MRCLGLSFDLLPGADGIFHPMPRSVIESPRLERGERHRHREHAHGGEGGSINGGIVGYYGSGSPDCSLAAGIGRNILYFDNFNRYTQKDLGYERANDNNHRTSIFFCSISILS